MHLSEIANALNNSCSDEITIKQVKIDSRMVEPGDLYLAIIGERLNGHQFIPQAIERGAVAIISSEKVNQPIPSIIVEDTTKALGVIASCHRLKFNIPVIAVTGSNGKTSVKEMIASILGGSAFATRGNLNNHIGVPLSLLALNPSHSSAVFELGANHPGEISTTAAMVKPHVSLINNVGPAHLEGFGSIEGVAKAKGEIYQSLSNKGWAIVNDDSEFSNFWDSALKEKRVIRFSCERQTDVYAENINYDSFLRPSFDLIIDDCVVKISLNVAGCHSVSNALAAASSCYAIGISAEKIESGLNTFTGVKGRMAFNRGINQSIVVDDTYNANLSSTLAAIDVLSSLSGKKFLLLGDMGELGCQSTAHHQRVGEIAKEKGIDHLFSCGSLSEFASNSFGSNAKHFESQQLLTEEVKSMITKDSIILAKGSRAAQMENVVTALLLTDN